MKRIFLLLPIFILGLLAFADNPLTWYGLEIHHGGDSKFFYREQIDSVVFFSHPIDDNTVIESTSVNPNITIEEAIGFVKEKVEQYGPMEVGTGRGLDFPIKDDGSHYLLHGRVISSDEDDNFRNMLIIQDETGTLKIRVYHPDLWSILPVGQEILFDLSGIGLTYYWNGESDIYIDWQQFVEHTRKKGEPEDKTAYIGLQDSAPADCIYLIKTSLEELYHYRRCHPEVNLKNKLVELDPLYFADAGANNFAEYLEQYNSRLLLDAFSSSANLSTSGYARYHNETLPEGWLKIRGILNDYTLTVNSADDIESSDIEGDLMAKSYVLHYVVSGKEFTSPLTEFSKTGLFRVPVNIPEEALADEGTIEWWISSTDSERPNFGVCPASSSESQGQLHNLSNGGVKGKISSSGEWWLTLDLQNWNYFFAPYSESLYVMSTSGTTFDNCAQLATSDNVTYEGMAGLLNAWGLAGQKAYKPILYVNNPNVEVNESWNSWDYGSCIYEGGLLQELSGAPLHSGIAIPFPGKGAGLYYITADLQTMTYTGYQCKSLGITGSMEDQRWGLDGEDIPLYGLNSSGEISSSTTNGSRTTLYMEWGGIITLKAGDEWKIRANGEWIVNFGGVEYGTFPTDDSQIELVMNGNNFIASEDGTYIVKIYLRREYTDGKMTPYYMTVVPVED